MLLEQIKNFLIEIHFFDNWIHIPEKVYITNYH